MSNHSNVVAIFTKPYTIELQKTSMPIISEEYVCVEYLYCGICGGDHSVYCGYRNSYPVSLGHEFVGRIVSVGNAVNNLSVGQYVVSDFNYRCNKCIYCRTERSHLCINNDIGLFSNRGFAKYASIHSSYLVAIKPPNHLPRACLIEPLSCVVHACRILSIKEGSRILLCGGGGIGMLFCFLLCRGYRNIYVTVAETNPQKLELLSKHFSVHKYKPTTQRKYDVIIDCTNTTSGLQFALDTAQRGSDVCVMSHLYGRETSFVYEQACKKELHCRFPLRNGSRDNLLVAANLIEQHWTWEDDEMLDIYDDVAIAFKEKASNSFCKQIICSSKLCVSDL